MRSAVLILVLLVALSAVSVDAALSQIQEIHHAAFKHHATSHTALSKTFKRFAGVGKHIRALQATSAPTGQSSGQTSSYTCGSEYVSAITVAMTTCMTTTFRGITDFENEAAIMARLPQLCGSSCEVKLGEVVDKFPRCMDGDFGDMVKKCRTNPQCLSQGFVDLAAQGELVCGKNSPDSIDQPMNKTIRANATQVWDNICTSKCLTLMQQVSRGAYTKCFDDDMSKHLNVIKASCQTTMFEGKAERCGAVMDHTMEMLECDRLKPDQCGAPYMCKMTVKGRCEINATQHMLAPMCDSCMGKAINAMSKSDSYRKRDSYDPMAEIIAARDMTCSKVGNAYCLPLVQPLMHDDEVMDLDRTNITGPVAEMMLKPICNVTGAKACMNKIMGVARGMSRRNALSYLKSCSNSRSMSSIRRYCLPRYNQTMMEVERSAALVSFLCQKNKQNKYCMASLRGFTNSSCFKQATSGNCTGCDSYMKTFTDEFGCCQGSIDSVFSEKRYAALVDPKSLPTVRSYNYTIRQYENWTITPEHPAAPINLTDMDLPLDGTKTYAELSKRFNDHTMSFALQCPTLNTTTYMATATIKCQLRSRPRPKKSMKLKLKWDKIKGNAVLKAKLLTSLKSDMSNSLGIPEAIIVNDDLVEDSSTIISTATAAPTAARRVAADGSAGSSAVEYTFEVDSENDEDAAAMEALSLSSGVTLTSTASVVSEDCASCTDTSSSTASSSSAGLESSISGGATSSGGATTGSGASAVSVALAVVAALVAIVA